MSHGLQSPGCPFEASDALANSAQHIGSNALTRRTKLAVFDLATCPAGLTEDSRAFVDCSGALAAFRVFLDPLRALVSSAAMSDLLGLSGRRVWQRPPRFELFLGFGGDKLAFLLPPAIPEPFAVFPEPAPANIGAKKIVRACGGHGTFYLILAGSRMLHERGLRWVSTSIVTL